MFWNRKEKKRKMEFIQNYVPTSKAQLLQVAMYFNKGDVQKAQEMFDFYSRNLDLPDFDPVAPTFMQQVRQTAGGLFSWIKENQEDIAQGYDFLRSIVQRQSVVTAGTQATEALPDINT